MRLSHQAAASPCRRSSGAGHAFGWTFFAPALDDRACGDRPVGVAVDGLSEPVDGGSMAEAELFVVVAVADDVGRVAVLAARHADVRASRPTSVGHHDVAAVDGASLGAGDGGGVGEHDVLVEVGRREHGGVPRWMWTA